MPAARARAAARAPPASRGRRGRGAPIVAPLPADYPAVLARLQGRIRGAQVGAALAVNRALILRYRRVGEAIVARQERAARGDGVPDRLGADPRRAFPGVGGLSRRNRYRLCALYRAYRDRPDVVPRVVAQLPWGHTIALLERLKDPAVPGDRGPPRFHAISAILWGQEREVGWQH